MDKINLHRIPSQPFVRQGQPSKIAQSPQQVVSRPSEQSDTACRIENQQACNRTISGTEHSHIGSRMGTHHRQGERGEIEGN